jgi:hypothetical protein
MHDLRQTKVTRHGATLLLSEGRYGEIPCGTETAARAFLCTLQRTERLPGETLHMWVLRCAEEHEYRAGRIRAAVSP